MTPLAEYIRLFERAARIAHAPIDLTRREDAFDPQDVYVNKVTSTLFGWFSLGVLSATGDLHETPPAILTGPMGQA